MGHSLTGLLAPWLPGVRGHQANGYHLLGPVAVVIAAAGRLTKVLLPAVAHFVDKGAQDVFVRALAKGIRVQGQLIGEGGGVDPVAKAVIGKVPTAAASALEGDEAGWQAAAEELLVEPMVSRVKGRVLVSGNADAGW